MSNATIDNPTPTPAARQAKANHDRYVVEMATCDRLDADGNHDDLRRAHAEVYGNREVWPAIDALTPEERESVGFDF